MKVNKKTNYIQVYARKDKKSFIVNNTPDNLSISAFMIQATLEKIEKDTGQKLSTV